MKTGIKGLDIIKLHEGFESLPYLDPVGIPTIGYGATHYGNGVKVKMTDKPITEEGATKLLKYMLPEYEDDVKQVVSVCLNQNQFDALVSFTYNLGGGALASSTLLKKVNKNPNDISIRTEFNRWVMGRISGRKIVLNGLVKRRQQESELYFDIRCH